MHHEYLHQNSCNTVFPRDMICLRNVSVDNLHKGDTEDNDYDNNNNNNNNNGNQILMKHVLNTYIIIIILTVIIITKIR
jgi:hypothetical protein